MEKEPSAIISVEGKDRFVVVPIEHYQYLRKCELEATLARTRTDLAEGRHRSSSPEEHLERLESGNKV